MLSHFRWKQKCVQSLTLLLQFSKNNWEGEGKRALPEDPPMEAVWWALGVQWGTKQICALPLWNLHKLEMRTKKIQSYRSITVYFSTKKINIAFLHDTHIKRNHWLASAADITNIYCIPNIGKILKYVFNPYNNSRKLFKKEEINLRRFNEFDQGVVKVRLVRPSSSTILSSLLACMCRRASNFSF